VNSAAGRCRTDVTKPLDTRLRTSWLACAVTREHQSSAEAAAPVPQLLQNNAAMPLLRWPFRSPLVPRQRAEPIPPPPAPESFEAALFEGDETLEVVGESQYQDNLWRIVGGRTAERVRYPVQVVLLPESDNLHDSNAISVWTGGLLVGYLPRELAAAYRPGLIDLQRRRGKPIALNALIIGGGIREDGPGLLGVFPNHDPTDFGIAPHRVFDGHLYEGESAAQLDGRLGWLGTIPSDPTAAVATLRDHLTRTSDPLDRHFLFLELEARLYRARDAGSSLLDFDATCISHDTEMTAIRPALLKEFGSVPHLRTYHPMAIRQSKAHAWTAAVWWVERGLGVYGSEAGSPNWPGDLEKRLLVLREKAGTLGGI
jgi:hypothetical protein